VAAGKKKKVLAASNGSTLKRNSGAGGEAQTYRHSQQLHVSKRKSEKFPLPYAWTSIR
jgi:hypothetical protein